MPTNGLPKLTVRAVKELKEAFIEASQHHEHGAAGVIRDFMRWYTWEPGVKMPRRPKPPPADAD